MFYIGSTFLCDKKPKQSDLKEEANMAVIPKWMCDRDNSMHDLKKDADAHDKMLELAEEFTALLED